VSEIRRAAVIGSGTMGSGIAAHIANAGVPVVMLDLGDAAARAAAGLAKRKPAPLVDRRAAGRITAGSLETDLALVADADWIVEAIVEDLGAKRELYRRLDTVRRPGSVVSSNTSTIPLGQLAEGAPDGFAADFMVSHFFNPPRYMQLLETVPGPDTRNDAVEAIEAFADVRLGKAVVRCNDTPGFVANRLGVYWIATAIGEALARGLTVEEADLLMGECIGAPRTGVFGLMDLVGLGLHEQVTASLDQLLPPADPWHDVPEQAGLFRRMIAMGSTGRIAGKGFYSREGSDRFAIDLETLEYRPAMKPRLEAAAAAHKGGLRALVASDDRYGAYATAVLTRVLDYASGMVPEVTDRPELIDLAMERGFNWRRGPFAMIAELAGAPARARIRPWGVVLLSDLRARPALESNASASLWDAGDEVACLEFHTKSNAIDDGTLELIEQAVAGAGERFRALVIYNEGAFFSTGANLANLLALANAAAWDRVRQFTLRGQRAFEGLKFAPVPVVGAPTGRCLGGGCEMLLHCDAVQAHTETYMGLVEVGVGLLPAWGGCRELLIRAGESSPGGPMPAAARAFEVIATASVSTSAQNAKELGYLRNGDRITANRDRLLSDAKALALELAEGYVAPEPRMLTLAGPSGQATLALTARQRAATSGASDYDLLLAGEVARVLTGGDADPTEPAPERAISELELAGIDTLIRLPQTLDRMSHMLATGKPLRNTNRSLTLT
jgi:3-hydroxyacyl-CoA dehydrogenase